jgi:polar amino acid transport system permease protein
MAYAWDFSVVWRNFGLLLDGLTGTLEITVVALICGLAFGMLAAAGRLSRRATFGRLAQVYIAVFRSTPPLVQLFWVFYALPILLQVRLEPFMAAAITLSLQSGAFFAEVLRGGIVSIERGQWEAGRALGMGYLTLMRRIILPQAVRRMTPALLERVVELMKTTSLVSSIAYADLLFQGMRLSVDTFRPLEIFTVVALMYFTVLFSISLAVRAMEARLARAG